MFDKRTGNLRPFTLLNDRRNEEIIHSGISVNVDYFDTDKIHLFADKIYTYDKSTGSFTIAHVADSSRYYGTVQRFYSDKDITYLLAAIISCGSTMRRMLRCVSLLSVQKRSSMRLVGTTKETFG